MKDALDRRLRCTKPQPVGERIELSERDYLIFEMINRHGPLPTHYLYEFTKHLCKNPTAAQHRLTKLYNGTKRTPPYLARSPQQFASFKARYQPLIYDLTSESEHLLAERGVAIVRRTDPFVHRLMTACVTASIELGCEARQLPYISQAEILARHGVTLELPLHTGKLIPDALFGIHYPRGFLFFAVEIDRGTESILRSNSHQTGFGQKLANYFELFDATTFKTHWGIPNLLVLTVTTSTARLTNMIAHVRQAADERRWPRLLFQEKAAFGANWSVPPVMQEMFSKKWERAGEPFDLGGS